MDSSDLIIYIITMIGDCLGWIILLEVEYPKVTFIGIPLFLLGVIAFEKERIRKTK